MEKVCPVCNKLRTVVFKCDKCNGIMYDKGRIEEYMDPYGAELPIDDSDNYCFHLFQCIECKDISRKTIKKMDV